MFNNSKQCQEELLEELEDKLKVWQEKINVLKRNIKKSETIKKELLIEMKAALEYLRQMNTFQFCERKAQLILQKTEDAVNLLFEEYRNSAILEKCLVLTSGEDMQLQKRWEPKRRNFLDSKTFTDDTPQKADHVHVDKQMKHLRKEVAGSILPIVQKAYMDASWQKECLSSLKPFINKCLFIGWMMVVQTPPMDFKSARKGDHFDKNIFNYYTKSGKFIDVVVWPALLLHKDGPVVGKGIAQPRIKTT
ncbi:hypothetical protein MAR_023195 [Mya arenaria]|uniref:Mitochondria-eating protein C-terminal domain-containing protein n=1 Tax=Mya arenaria TaxID=6604 RepID=A0ABY7DQF0_MYAAR|nr:hypothetical protein MAR_023184 [Mya arenaria]WAQ98822.1 hypothetical protein MAR_023195 [Mya arenaria]